jgi:tellurite resistance protein TerA
MATELAKGANASLPSGKITVVVAHAGPDTDLSALQLTAAGKVRSDDDFVFYGQPKSPEGAVQYRSKTNEDGGYLHQMDFALDAIPAAIDKVAITLTIDPTTPSNFGSVVGLALAVTDDKGTELVQIIPEGSTETALILAELYRRNGTWKVRHVGQGFNNGLKGIATSFGVSVADEAPTSAAPPVVAPAPAPVVTQPPAPPKPAPTINLDKPAPVGKVNLTKGNKISIAKGAVITATGGWDNTWGKLDYDLYAHVAYTDGTTEVINYARLVSKNGAVRHSGDLKSGGSGVQEQISVRMTDDIACVGFSFYSARENGSGSFSNAHARVSLDNGEGSTITLGVSDMSVDSNRYTLYFGTVINRGTHKVDVVAHEDYSRKNSERQPVLSKDGTHKMDAGPENAYK